MDHWRLPSGTINKQVTNKLKQQNYENRNNQFYLSRILFALYL